MAIPAHGARHPASLPLRRGKSDRVSRPVGAVLWAIAVLGTGRGGELRQPGHGQHHPAGPARKPNLEGSGGGVQRRLLGEPHRARGRGDPIGCRDQGRRRQHRGELAGQMAAGEAATLIAWTAASSELATSLGIGAEFYLTYQAIACGNPEAAGLLFTGFTLTGQSLVQNGLRRAADRVSRGILSVQSDLGPNLNSEGEILYRFSDAQGKIWYTLGRVKKPHLWRAPRFSPLPRKRFKQLWGAHPDRMITFE
jgi:hypothetical protein